MQQKTTKYALTGTIACFLFAVIFYCLYVWTNGSVWAGIFARANGSVWELCKTLLAAYALGAILECVMAKPPFKRFVVAKTAGLTLLLTATIAFHALLAAVAGHVSPTAGCIAAAVFLFLAQAASSAALRSSKKIEAWFTVCVFALILLSVMYISFTVNPPHVALFEDPQTGIYGLPSLRQQGLLPV